MEFSRNSKIETIWIHSIVLATPIFFRSGGVGISVLDVIFAVYFFASLLFWFFWKTMINKKTIVHNIADFFLLLFPLLSIGTIIISLINGVTFLDAIREYVMFTFVLFYFPIRENINTKKSLVYLAITFSITVIGNDIGQFYNYYIEFSKGIRYAYQIIIGERTNQTIFTFSIVNGILFFLMPQKLISRIWIVLVIGLTSISLISTASRSFWILVLASIVLMLIFLPLKQKILLIFSSFISILIIIIPINLFFQDKAEVVFQAIELRLKSSTEGKKDVSVTQRFLEYDKALKKIEENPLGGNGFSKPFTYYNTIIQQSIHSIYIHNGYLYYIYRYGLPLSIIYFFIIFYFFVKSIYTLFKQNDLFYKYISISGFFGLFILIIASVASAQFMNRDGIFIMAISFALVEVSYYNLNKTLSLSKE